MSQKLILPELGDGIQKATVAVWHYQVGEKIEAGADVVEVVTDKASFSISAQKSGKLETILVPQGQEAVIGETLGLIQ